MLKNIPLQKHNTLGLSAVAERYVAVSNLQELLAALDAAASLGIAPLILGGGSNVLFTKPAYPLVIHNKIKGFSKLQEGEDWVEVKAGSGERWHTWVMHCIDQGWGGIENLSLIPGTVGAAPMQNIGAYGVELKETLVSVEALHLPSRRIQVFDHQDGQFGYRDSFFKRAGKGQYFILSVALKLTKGQHRIQDSYGAIREVLTQKNITTPTLQEMSQAVIDIRQSKLPSPDEIGNAGSFFKNPIISQEQWEGLRSRYPDMPYYRQPGDQVKIPAGWLIEQCGWKGKRQGSFGVHHRQSLVLVNFGGGTGEEIQALARQIQADVNEQWHIALETEVNFV